MGTVTAPAISVPMNARKNSGPVGQHDRHRLPRAQSALAQPGSHRPGPG